MLDLGKLLAGDRRTLAKAITLVESAHTDHRQQSQEILEQILPSTGNSIRIGISGTPGVGKSTFIEALGGHIVKQGKKVAVLAVDPSSPIGGGSILGDKTRMEALSREANAFIRPSPTSGQLGGVALRTRESLLLCEAAGFNVILIETVGVGQSEFDVADMVDFFAVLIQPNSGDDLQGIKKGIIELADALIINKADGDGKVFAKQSLHHYQNAVNLLTHAGFWEPKVITCSAKENTGIDTAYSMIETFMSHAVDNGELQKKRASQNKAWMKKILSEMIELKAQSNPQFRARQSELEALVETGRASPYACAKTLTELL